MATTRHERTREGHLCRSGAGLLPLLLCLALLFCGVVYGANYPVKVSSAHPRILKAIPGSPCSNTGTREFTTPGKNSAGEPDWALVFERVPE